MGKLKAGQVPKTTVEMTADHKQRKMDVFCMILNFLGGVEIFAGFLEILRKCQSPTFIMVPDGYNSA